MHSILFIVLEIICFSITKEQNSIESTEPSNSTSKPKDYFMHKYINSSVLPFCTEKQENLRFKFSFRARKEKNINSHFVYLFSKDKVFSIPQMTAALEIKEKTDYVIPELFFNDIQIKDINEFWNQKSPNQTFNGVFTDPMNLSMAFWIFGEQYQPIKISVDDFKVIEVQPPISFNESNYGFFKNPKIVENSSDCIFSIDIADVPLSPTKGFRPIRVYVRDESNDGNVISFAFYNESQINEEFENGKHYLYGFDTGVWLIAATSLTNKFKDQQYSHYFELRTQRGTFSLFDFTYNRNFLLVGTNEELLGCPPSFCHSREFDDIIQLQNGTKLLVFHEWFWNFQKPGEKIDWNTAVISNMLSRQHITRKANFPNPFKFGVRHIVDGSFIDDSFLYIFRNGSFIKSKDDSIVDQSLTPDKFKLIRDVFKGIPSITFDAILYQKRLRIVIFIKEYKFWSYSLADNKLTNGDKHIENLGLPYTFKVKSVYVEEDNSGKQIKFYLFTENRYIVFDENEFDSGRFRAKQHIYYCTSVNFFGCPENEFVCPPQELESTTLHISTDGTKESGSKVWIICVILLVIVIILVIIIAVYFFSSIVTKKSDQQNHEKKAQKDLKTKSKANNGINAQPMDSVVADNTRSTL